ncbi:putative centriole, cilia and spindle-associated protein [Apostichopus japonicus]|uniref:Putative centriole, cilia and spindle-associated protein n=1 Tax=Stichopus japonicus TaxID=307972 RepID=A0A2G8JVP9_STIJA|nr:putative centriole, cilia and spindle-associated protein [Apostichopus japonicus]
MELVNGRNIFVLLQTGTVISVLRRTHQHHQLAKDVSFLLVIARKSSGKKKQSGLRQKRKSRPISSPNKDAKCERSDLTPPFLAFGWADATKGVGAKQTFNVRAANEVHPAALRAFKRRELDILRNEEERQRETLKKKRTRALFNASTHLNDKEDDMWLTEYQRNFSARTPSR